MAIMTTEKLREIVSKLPAYPGIYFFKNANSKSIYIGKASSLKNRILSYLKTEDSRIRKMVTMAKSLKFIVTDSDIEALILESQYIKKYKPMFNIVMRDDKQYGFVAFTKEKFPKIYITHQPTKIKNAKIKIVKTDFIGPFTEISALKTTLQYLRKIFPYCTCKQLHNNYCLNYHIGKCFGICCLKQQIPVSSSRFPVSKEYNKNIKAIKDILAGKKRSLIKKFEKEMLAKAKNENFEDAINIRGKLERLQRVFKNAQIINKMDFYDISKNHKVLELIKRTLHLSKIPSRIEAYDISNIQGTNATGSMVVFDTSTSLNAGNLKPNKNEYRKFKIKGVRGANDTAMIREVLSRRLLNHPEWPSPDLIIIDGGKNQLRAAEAVISNFQFSISNKFSIKQSPIIALTKDKKHKGIKLTTAKGEMQLSTLPTPVKNLILHIDAEAHRFAINYYRKLHRKLLI